MKLNNNDNIKKIKISDLNRIQTVVIIRNITII